MTHAPNEYRTACIIAPIADSKVEDVKKAYPNVLYRPDGNVSDEELKEIDIWYCTWTGLPKNVTQLAQIPRTKAIQLSSAGANMLLATEVMSTPEARDRIKVCSASGIHVLSIPQYIVANVVNLYMKLQIQFHLARTRSAWPSRDAVLKAEGAGGQAYPGNRYLYGKTVGLLGYGHIARETARLLQCFNCTIIAANSSGSRRVDDGYIVKGTGDKEGTIPSAYYRTTDPASFREFLSKCDVLVASLPSTPETQWMLTPELMGLLPDGSVFVNVGRGDLVKSDTILSALDASGGLTGVVLDVTDPEPLPNNHPLWTHPSAIVTPHTSGSFENYYEAGADLLIAQMERIQAGERLLNVVDPAKGY